MGVTWIRRRAEVQAATRVGTTRQGLGLVEQNDMTIANESNFRLAA